MNRFLSGTRSTSAPAASFASILLFALLASGCATTNPTADGRSSAGSAPESGASKPAPTMSADRQAILSMVGEFGVTFAFDETVPLVNGYEPRDAKRSGAAEAVILVEDDGDRIVLQHLLLVGDSVVKHWRQDWTYEADARFEFTDDQTWRLVPLSEEQTAGAWTQCVYEVSDAPRYCGTGKWNHRYGNATWTSDRTWRPLPRREYTTRDDYTAMNVENRHTITPTGWTHEQDNSKVVRVDGRTEDVLVREFGFNHYMRTDRTDFGPVYAYWDDTAGYWARVRGIWNRMLANGGVVLETDVDGMPIIEGLFDLADAARDDAPIAEDRIEAVFDAYVVPLDARLAGE